MIQDLRFSLRNLRNNPGFALIAVATLALGIGANTAIFSVVHSVLLKPLPYPQPERLMLLDDSIHSTGHMSVSWPNFLDWRVQNRSFEGMAAIRSMTYNYTGGDQPEVIRALATSSSLFDLLGAKPFVGRFYNADEDKPGAAPVVLLSHSFWQRRFGGDPSAIGRAITLSDVSYTVVGVLPSGFSILGRDAEMFTPIGLNGGQSMWMDRGNHVGIRVIARLKRDASVEQARADMQAIAARLQMQYPVTNSGVGVLIEPFQETLVKDARPTLQLLLAAVGFVLLTACANVANLLLARGSARQRELSVRAALGASRLRVIRQLLVESSVLAIAGGALGCLIAEWGLDALLRLAPQDVPRLSQASLDGAVLAFTIGVSLFTGVLFGLAPAWRLSRPDLVNDLKTGGRGQSAGRSSNRLRSTLLVAEVALALLMVTGAGLMLRSIVSLQRVSPGFQTDGVLTFGIMLPNTRYPQPKQGPFFQQALQRIRAIPGVEGAATVDCVPLYGGCWGSIFTIEGRPVPSNADLPHAEFNSVSAGYFETMKTPLVAGRFFNEQDTEDSTKVVVINQTMAHHMWPGENPIGKRIRQGYPQSPGPLREVVGVVGDMQRYELDHQPFDEVYFVLTQSSAAGTSLVVRTAGQSGGSPMAMLPAIAEAIHGIDKDQPLANPKPMAALLADTLAQRKFSTILLAVFAALALTLAGVGIYGVTAYSVTLRTQEVGIRMAVGAQQRDVLRLVLRQGLQQALAGVAAGLAASAALTWLIASLLYGVEARDPLTLAAASATLVTVALVACYLPARRAAKLDPMVALRVE
jgi:putative ABC transport system permease protein